MASRRSDRGRQFRKDPEGLMDMLDATTPIGDIKSWAEFVKDPSLASGLLAVAGLIPGVPARKLQRDWKDVPLTSSSRTVKNDLPKKFLESHGFTEIPKGTKPTPNTYRYTDDGKIEAYSGVGRNGVAKKTFSESTSLKTLRKWMGY